MIVKLLKPKAGLEYDITNALSSYSWKGATLSAGRSMEIAYLNAPYDRYVDIPQIAIGDFLTMMDERTGKEVFYGQLFGAERSSSTGTISFTAYDMMKNLLESNGRYNFKNQTAEAIAYQVCADIQVPVGELAATGVNIKSLLANKTPFYDIIMGAYTKAHLIDGKCYMAMIWNRKFNVYEANWYVAGFELSDKKNVTDVNIRETVEDLKNQVRIYDSKGKQIGEVKDESSIEMFGVFQEVYEQEEGIDANTAAKRLLHKDPVQRLSVTAIGDINCLSGYRVLVKDGATGVSAAYWITSDRHTWSGGVHTMELELQFDQIMDEKDVSEEGQT